MIGGGLYVRIGGGLYVSAGPYDTTIGTPVPLAVIVWAACVTAIVAVQVIDTVPDIDDV